MPSAVRKLLFCIACLFCGWVAAFAMPHVSFWPCMFAGLSGLYYLYSRTAAGGGAFAAGFFFGIGYFVTGLWWIGNALLVEGNEFAWVWPISVIGLPTLLSLFTGLYLGVARIMTNPKTFGGFFAFSFFLTFSEYARGNAFTGFPWNLYGYVWADHLPMAQMAHVTGAYGMTFITILWAAAAGFLFAGTQSPKVKSAIIGTVVLTMALAFFLGQHRLENNQTAFDKDNAVIVVQPNIAQNMKWDPVALQSNFEKTVSLSKGAQFQAGEAKNIFIVWPETAISPTVYTVPENMERIRQMLESYKGRNAYLVTGVLRREEKADGEISYANSVVFLNSRLSAIDVYDKHHLVPFGEFIPFQDWIPLKPVAAFKGFQRGTGAATVTTAGIPSFSPLICYEIIFPESVIKRDNKPDWIANVTNDGWYGDSSGPRQHFAQTRLRAIEEGIPVVRSANTGISGIIDPYGRVVEKADIFQEAILVHALPEKLEDRYAAPRHSFPVILLAGALMLMAAFFLRSKFYTKE
jgi:apolipoprotein N-acyltransferase